MDNFADYGEANMALALRGLEAKATDPYLAGWRKRVAPTLGHIPVSMITYGAVDRAVHSWIANECGRSTVKNTLSVLVRVMEQATPDGLIDGTRRTDGRAAGVQARRGRARHLRSLALLDWHTLTRLANALVARSAGQYRGWGGVVLSAACTAARIGEVSGCRVTDIDTTGRVPGVRRRSPARMPR